MTTKAPNSADAASNVSLLKGWLFSDPHRVQHWYGPAEFRLRLAKKKHSVALTSSAPNISENRLYTVLACIWSLYIIVILSPHGWYMQNQCTIFHSLSWCHLILSLIMCTLYTYSVCIYIYLSYTWVYGSFLKWNTPKNKDFDTKMV